jgi:hypothetical protein
MKQIVKILVVWMAVVSLGHAGIGQAADESWSPAKGPLATRWAKDVSPTNALPEYPRPQMVRKEWQNLNGLWDYAITGRSDSAPQTYEGKILVPYPIESALSGVMKRLDEKSRLWYRRTFQIPTGWSGKRVLLHFGAVDWEATIAVNGKEIGAHRGGYDGFSFDITDALKPAGKQELVVAIWDPTEGGQPRGKQVRKPGGIMYTPTSGIWRTVWIEPVPESYIQSLRIEPDVDNHSIRVTPEFKGTTAGLAVGAQVKLTLEDKGIRSTTSVTLLPVEDQKLDISLGTPIELWSPDSPTLYDLEVALLRDGKEIDKVASYFGMRKIALGKDDKGITRLMLNGKFIFQIGPLDQGFWPDGIYTAPTDEALRYDIEMTRKLGMNMCRKHVKIEPERWYYWCDKLGLMIWQDMPSANNRSDEDKKQFEQELKALIESHRNHPSIIMWVVFNEGWGQHDTERLTRWVKELDPSRLVNNASGWADKKVGDVIDMHSYPGPGSPKPELERAAVLGEFGGLGLGVDGHTWAQKTWGYRGMASRETLTTQYIKLLRKVYDLINTPGLSAAVYTQTTDVETECNGLMTYDRAMVKPDPEKVAAANRGQFPPAPQVKVLVPTAETERLVWRYTLDKPADDWFKPDFDASSWKEGPAGFGTKGTPGSVVRTEWRSPDIWLRREFTLGKMKLSAPLLLIHHDEDAEVYLNGTLAAKVTDFTTYYEEIELSPQARALLTVGKNVMAVHCHQTSGGQYIDVGIADQVEPSGAPRP